MIHSTGAYVLINSAAYCKVTRSFAYPPPPPLPLLTGMAVYLCHSSNLDYSHIQSTALKLVNELQSLLIQKKIILIGLTLQ